MVVVVYVVCATIFLICMISVNGCPDPSIVPEDVCGCKIILKEQQFLIKSPGRYLKNMSILIFILTRTRNVAQALQYDYMISLGLLYLNFNDAVREGYGDKV